MATFFPLLLAVPFLAQRVAVPAAEEPAPERTTLTVAGRVTRNDARACGVAVHVGVTLAGEELGSTDTTTDAEGRFLVEIEVPGEPDAARGRRPLFAFAYATEPGYQQRELRQLFVGDATHAELGAVELHEGGTIRLRVVDADGDLLPHGAVRVDTFPGPPKREPPLGAWRAAEAERPVIVSRPADPSVFAVNVAAGTRLGLLARASGVGTAWIEDVAAPSDGVPFDVELVLRGPATLDGVLVSPDGSPLAGMPLVAFPADLIDAADPAQALYLERALREIAGGLVTDTTTTDAAGRFAFRGLQAGAYFVQSALDPVPAAIERRALPTGLPARIVARQHRLVVDVIAADGGTATGRLSCTKLPAPPSRQHEPGVDNRPGERVRVDCSHRLELDVEPGERYAVAWNGEGQYLEREVAIEPGAWRTHVELQLAGALPPARLSVLVRDPAGGPYELLDLEELRLTITSAATGALVLGRLASPSRASEIVLPAGDWTVVVEPAHETMMCGNGVVWPLLWHAEERVALTLAPGEERELVVAPPLGGRVRLSLDVEDDVTDQRLRRMPSAEDDWQAFIDLWQDERFPHARVTANGAERPFLFHLVDDGTGTSGGWPGMLPGTTAVSASLLRPGPNVLRVEVPGFEPAEANVVARAGETVDVRVVLRERR